MGLQGISPTSQKRDAGHPLRWQLILFDGEEVLGFEGAALLLEEDLDAVLGGVELGLAGVGDLDALFEEADGFVERQVAVLELVDDGFEVLELIFKVGHT